MSKPDPQTVALFRYGLIAEFVHLPANTPGLYAKLQDKAQPSYNIPGSLRTRVAAETLRDWLKSLSTPHAGQAFPKKLTCATR
jgi:hypothetical protein